MSQVNSTSSIAEIMKDINIGPTNNVQMMFAKLQLAQSELCKNQAESYMKQIEDIQDEQKKALGLPENEPVVFDQKEMTPELEKLFAAAKAEAERAGKACASQLSESAQAPSAPAARRGAVRV